MSQEINTTANIEHANDAHDHESHEGHFIADWRMQVGILVILLLFTALTVGFYNFEQWIETAFNIHLPKWVNIAGAMSIATVKGLLVAAFFMQLKYDKAINTFVMLYCLFCVGLFLTFTMIDLGSRDWVDEYKMPSITQGGTGVGLNNAPIDPNLSISIGPKVNTAGMNIVYHSRLHGNKNKKGLLYYRENDKEAAFWTQFYDGGAAKRDTLDEHDFYTQLGYANHNEKSDANKSRPKRGLTPGLFDDVDPEANQDNKKDNGH